MVILKVIYKSYCFRTYSGYLVILKIIYKNCDTQKTVILRVIFMVILKVTFEI